ncbi:MAG: hypothetical protein KDN22_02220 [Verrucomicrobiae bacterium]|nr:hypothetical protein [Verrucomicrobiae bacterium]
MIGQKNLNTALLVFLAIGAGMILGKHRESGFSIRSQTRPESMATVTDDLVEDAALYVYKSGTNPFEHFVRITDEAGVPHAVKLHRLSQFLGSLDRDSMHAFLLGFKAAPDELTTRLGESLHGSFTADGWWGFLIYSRWAELEDLAAALAFVEAEDIGMDSMEMLTVWGLRHTDQALELAVELTEGERLYLNTGIALSIARNAPLKALRFLEDAGLEIDELGGSPDFVEWTNPECFIPRSAGEIDDMIRHIHGAYTDEMDWAIEELQGSLYAALAKHDPTQVVERLEELDDEMREQMIDAMSQASSINERVDFLRRSGLREPFTKEQKNLINAMVFSDQDDPFSPRPSNSTIDGMVEWINAIESPEYRKELAESLAASVPYTPDNAQVLTALLGETPNISIHDIGLQDPERAWQMLNQAAGSDEAEQEDSDLSADWMLSSGAENALNRALALPSGILRDRVVQAIASGLSNSDPATIEALIRAIPEADSGARAGLIQGLAESDPLRAIDWLTSGEIAPSASATAAFQEAAKNWVGNDAESALPWLIEHRDSLPDQVFVESGAVSALADRDIDAALEFVATMVGQASYPELTGQLFSTWSQTQPAEASAYIDAHMEPGPVRDQAVKALVKQLQRYDKETARNWAETIQDEAVRASTLPFSR